jgi:aquaporin Z
MDIDLRKYAAEAVGTFVLVFGGVGSAVLAGPRIGNLGVALAFGLALLAMVYAIGPISGCHVNPAVTLGVLLARKIEARQAVGYVVAQVVGAIVAAGVLLIIAKGLPGGYNPAVTGFGANGYDAHSPAHYGVGAVFLTEVVLTFLLVFTVLGATDVHAPVGFAGLGIGLVLTLIHLVGIPIDNLSVNPARSIGPAIFVGGWALGQLWLFAVAPLVGGAIAAGAYQALHLPGPTVLTLAEAQQALPGQQDERLTRAES